MSDNQTNPTTEKEQVVLDLKDTEVVEKFFTFFEIDMPDYLQEALAAFNKDQSLDNQNRMKLAITKSIEDRREKFLEIDEIFEPVVGACGETAYNMQFDKDLKEVLGSEEVGDVGEES